MTNEQGAIYEPIKETTQSQTSLQVRSVDGFVLATFVSPIEEVSHGR